MIKTLLALLLVSLVSVPLLVGLAGIQSAPLVEPAGRLSHQDIARVKQLVRQHGPRQGQEEEVRVLSLTERDLNLLLAYAAHRSGNTSGRTELRPDGMKVELTIELPRNPLGGYLNITANFLSGGDQIRLQRLRVGELELPGWTLQPLLLGAHRRMLARYDEYRALAESITSHRFHANRVVIRYRLTSTLVGELRDKGKVILLPESDSRRMLAYHKELVGMAKRYGSRSVSLDQVLVPLFRLAAARTDENGDPQAENRALLLTLTIHSLGMNMGRFIDVPAGSHARTLRPSLLGRHDLAQHYLVSAGLAVAAGSGLAGGVGVFKELEDSRGGSGFSFADLLADRAGIRLAQMATATEKRARLLQQRMSGPLSETDFMPEIDDLPEGVMELEFKRRYRDLDSNSYRMIEAEIEQRLSRCSIYSP
jgi:hypothetical protein